MRIRSLTLCGATALLLCLHSASAADNEDRNNTQLPTEEKAFLQFAATSDTSQIELSKVAAAKSQTPALRSFAQQMVLDQTNNYSDLKVLSEKKSYLIAPQIDSVNLNAISKLQAGVGDAAFDHAYIDAMVADHADMEATLERIANNSNDSDIKQFAFNTLASVKKHDQMARNLAL